MTRCYSAFDFFIMCERMSMGSGKTIVEFFSADIVLRVCKGEQRERGERE